MRRLRYTLFILLCLIGTVAQAENAGKAGRDYLYEGFDHYERGRYYEAMDDFIKGYQAAEGEGDAKTLACCTGYIGNIYSKLGDQPRCSYYLDKGYNMAVAAADTVLMRTFLENMVATYCKQGQLNRAKAAFEKQRELASQGSGAESRYYIIYNEARIAKCEGHLQEALRLHHEAIDLAEAQGMDEHYQLLQLAEIAELQLRAGQGDQALAYGQQCLAMAQRLGDVELTGQAYSLLSEATELMGDATASELWHGRFLALNDSLFGMQRFFTLAAELQNYEIRRTDQHIDQLQGLVSKQWFTIVAFSIVTIVFVLLIIFLVVALRKLRRTQQVLVAKNSRLIESEERSQLLRQHTGHMDQLQQRIVEALDDPAVIATPELSLPMLAKRVGSNTKYVSQIVNDTFGCSFKALLNERRIQRACRLLTDRERYGNLTIQAIYQEVGYSNAVSFIRAFKRINGMTPSEYQKASVAQDGGEQVGG